MKIDLATLRAVTFGDPEAKLTVKRAWLVEVYKLLVEGASYKQQYLDLQRTLKANNITVSKSTIPPDAQQDLDDGMDQVDSGIDKIFGTGGAFDKIFKGKKHG